MQCAQNPRVLAADGVSFLEKHSQQYADDIIRILSLVRDNKRSDLLLCLYGLLAVCLPFVLCQLNVHFTTRKKQGFHLKVVFL